MAGRPGRDTSSGSIVVAVSVLFQKLRIKRPRQQVSHLDGFGLAVQVCKDHWDIPAEFPDDLAADATWRSQFLGVRDNGDLFDLSFALRYSVPNGYALGTDR